MLALTDTALARLCIGATAIAPETRRRWLKRSPPWRLPSAICVGIAVPSVD
jgi:hypothetical protein